MLRPCTPSESAAIASGSRRREGELSAYFEEVKRRARMTNTMYQETVLPTLRERQATAARQEGNQHERIERARREAEKLRGKGADPATR